MRSMVGGHARCFLSSLYVTLLRPFPSTTFGGPPPRAGEDRPQPAAFRPSSSRAQAAAQTKKGRSEEHTSELQSLMRISYAVFCLKKKNTNMNKTYHK